MPLAALLAGEGSVTSAGTSPFGPPYGVLEKPRQAKVADVRPPLFIEKDVGGLQVAVQYPFFVGILYDPSHQPYQPRGSLRVAGEALHRLGQAATTDEFHHEVRLAQVQLRFVYRDKVGVLQSG